jgi:MoaA/NifB/PqqE/SkfB family radical SAM enzyme
MNLKDTRLSREEIRCLLELFVKDKVLCVRINADTEMIADDEMRELYAKAAKDGLGLEWNLEPKMLELLDIEVLDSISDYINFILLQKRDIDSVISCIRKCNKAVVRVCILVDHSNLGELNGIITELRTVSEKISAVYCMPRYSINEDSLVLSQDEVDDLSVDLIDIADETEDSFPVYYKDGSDEIRCLLSGKTVMSSVYIEADGEVMLNEWFHISFGNVKDMVFSDIWKNCNTFWFNDKTKLYFSGFMSLYQLEKPEYFSRRIQFREIVG